MNKLDNDFKMIKSKVKCEFIRQRKEELEMFKQMKYINGRTYLSFFMVVICLIILCFVLIRLR